jgi:predicted nucleic acid-binding protein
MVRPERQDHIAAAEVRNTCRKAGVQIGTIDALLIQLCGRHELALLPTDKDFLHAASHVPFKLWRPHSAA